MTGPCWKPEPRHVNPEVFRRLHRLGGYCVCCRSRDSLNLHHVLPRGQGGDDCESNLVFLCGSGASGHHGAVHGSPFVDPLGRRWTAQDALQAVGRHIRSSRPDVVSYVLGKLGETAGRDYLERRYAITLPEYAPA